MYKRQEYPYNPDNQNDGHVGIEDILEILTVYGEEFTPEQLMVEGTSLTEWIQLLSETVIQQQAQIDSLESIMQEPSVVDSLSALSVAHIDFDTDQWSNPLLEEIPGRPDIIICHYPTDGAQGELPIGEPDPSLYAPFDRVVIMMGSAPEGWVGSAGIRLHYTRFDGFEDNHYFAQAGFVELLLGLDGFWRIQSI